MIVALVAFELRRRSKLVSTYVYALLLGGSSLFVMMGTAGAIRALPPPGTEQVLLANGPFQVHDYMTSTALTVGLFTIAAVFGQAAAQDFLCRTWALVFTTRVRKTQYLLGRFLGALAISTLIFLAIPVGQFLGALIAQALEAPRLGPHRVEVYLWPFVTAVLPMLFVAGTVFFALAALARKMAPVYVGAVVMVLGYVILTNAAANVDNVTLAAVLDPFGLVTTAVVSRYWTPFELNHHLVPLSGLVLANRGVWLGAGVGTLALAFRFFRIGVDEQRDEQRPGEEQPAPVSAAAQVTPRPTLLGWLWTALGGGWLLFREVARSPIYWSLVVAGLLAVLFGIIMTARLETGIETLPVTWQVLQLAGRTFSVFSLITIAFYAGELVWRERDARVADLVDSTPAPGWVSFTTRVTALFLVAGSLRLVAGGAALLSQVGRGYFAVEPSLYVTELLGFGLLKDVPICALAIAVQVIVDHKYLGHAAMVGFFVSQIALRSLGVEDHLVLFGSEPTLPWSDMNGYGHRVGAALLYRGYWYAITALLLGAAGLLTVRGREASLRERLRLAGSRATRAWAGAMGTALATALALGGFLFYRTHVVDPWLTSNDEERLKAQYEKAWKKWKHVPQPRVTAADLSFDLFPEEAEPRLVAAGTYTLTNQGDGPIPKVLLSLPEDALVDSLWVGSTKTAEEHDPDQGAFVYALDPPLAPGASVALGFRLQFVARALGRGSKRTDIVANGTNFSSANLPVVGYRQFAELADENARRSQGLPPREPLARRDDPVGLVTQGLRPDADVGPLRATVSTALDQTAVLPGVLEKEWTQGGRRHFAYRMQQPVALVFSVLSARYAVRRDAWGPVTLEVFHHPAHTANLERMVNGLKESLAYCSTAFSPYQFSQARILEFPRYATFAQATPGTILYSEGVGFIARVRDGNPDDVDFPYYVTAHEIAHQWWGHQVMPAAVVGANMPSETLAQYSALMVMKQRFGEKRMRRFLKYELDGYLRGRGREQGEERPLGQVENQPHIFYQKGSLAMYALQHFITEERVNRALRRYLEAVVARRGPPYTTSLELEAALREETPPEYQYLLDDLFETITLYDNRALSATVRGNGKGGWEVAVRVMAAKYRSDGKGEQQEVDLNDFIDVGALDESGQALFIEPRRIPRGESVVTFTVLAEPARVGLDPLNMLIDRDGDDNTIAPVRAAP